MKSPLWSSFLFLAAILAVLPTVQAQDDVRGVISTVVGTSITISSDKLGEMAYGIGAQTKILKADGAPGTAADLAPGAWVKITPGGEGNQAALIQVFAPKETEKR